MTRDPSLTPVSDGPLATVTAPDGLTVEILARHAGASTARFIVPPRSVGKAVKHRSVTETWTVLDGAGLLWRRRDGDHRVDTLAPGVTVTLEPDTCFQVRVDAAEPLVVIASTTPPWPGDDEARPVVGHWTPTLVEPLPSAAQTLRAARPEERDELTAIARRSKAWWGYDEAFLVACEAELTVTEALVAHTVVTTCDEQLTGLATVLDDEEAPDAASLEFLFVDPRWMGRGAGRMLMTRAVELAADLGRARLLIEADPDAEPFYRACGARRVGSRPSVSIPGRELPLLAVDTGRTG